MPTKTALRVNLKIPARHQSIFLHLSQFERPTEEILRLLSVGLKWDPIDSNPKLLFGLSHINTNKLNDSLNVMESHKPQNPNAVLCQLDDFITEEFLTGPSG